jgi:hypothetical protein
VYDLIRRDRGLSIEDSGQEELAMILSVYVLKEDIPPTEVPYIKR